jgi:hypothetical protein
MLQEVQAISRNDYLLIKCVFCLGLAGTVKQNIIKVVEFDLMLIGSRARTCVNLHHFLFGLGFLLKILDKNACVAFADQALKRFQGTLLKKFSDVTLDRSL